MNVDAPTRDRDLYRINQLARMYNLFFECVVECSTFFHFHLKLNCERKTAFHKWPSSGNVWNVFKTHKSVIVSAREKQIHSLIHYT